MTNADSNNNTEEDINISKVCYISKEEAELTDLTSIFRKIVSLTPEIKLSHKTEWPIFVNLVNQCLNGNTLIQYESILDDNCVELTGDKNIFNVILNRCFSAFLDPNLTDLFDSSLGFKKFVQIKNYMKNISELEIVNFFESKYRGELSVEELQKITPQILFCDPNLAIDIKRKMLGRIPRRLRTEFFIVFNYMNNNRFITISPKAFGRDILEFLGENNVEEQSYIAGPRQKRFTTKNKQKMYCSH